MCRVLLVDDHPLVRETLAEMLAKQEDVDLVGEASSGPEALDLTRRHAVDLVLLDISMPGRSGLETLEELKALPRPPKVVMLTGHGEDEIAVRCMKAGADGYVTKCMGVGELLHAIEKVSSGGKFISADLAEQIALSFDTSRPQEPHSELNNRELEIMCRLAKGQTASEIASELFLSAKTVTSYRSRILRKTGLRNNPQIIRYALEHGLIP